MNEVNFLRPQRESVLAIVLSGALFLKKLLTILWPLLVVYLLKGDTSKLFASVWFYIGILGILLIATFHGIFSWRKFFFYIKEGEFVVEKGYLKKSVTSLPLEKIISVNTNQKLLHQLLGVVELIVDSAGSKEQEVKISAVSKSYANMLKSTLIRASEYQHKEVVSQPNPTKESKPLIALSILDLLKIGIARNHLQTIALIFAFYFQIQNQVQDFFKDEVEAAVGTTVSYLEHSDIFIWSILIILVLFTGIIISILRTFLFNFDLKLLKTHNSFVLKWGLWKRKTITMPFSRIQAVLEFSNPLERLFRMSTVQLIQASGREIVKDSEKVLVRGCSAFHTKGMKEAFLSQKLWDNLTELKVHRSLLVRNLIIGNMLLIPLGGVVYFHSFLWWLLILGEFFIVTNATLTYQRRKYLINNEILQSFSGAFVYKTTTISHNKVQAVSLQQTLFQRWRGIANLKLNLAGTTVKVSYISYERAVQLRDYILYEINKYNRSWM